MITMRELAKWLKLFSVDKRIPTDIRMIFTDMYRRTNAHGNSGYTNGCRCDVCKTARRMQMRERRK